MRQQVTWLFVLLIILFGLDALGTTRSTFDSHEVHFTDASKNGLAIMPASCSSHPSYYHHILAPFSGTDFISHSGEVEYGAYKNGVYICVTNVSGSNYFVPGGSAAEMSAFKSAAGPIPNLDAW